MTTESQGICEISGSPDNIRGAATKLKDEVMLTNLEGINLIAKEVQYHHMC